MSKKTVAEFSIEYIRYLDPEGRMVGELPIVARDVSKLLSLYQMMVKTRIFDNKAIALQRTGQLGTYPSTLGQEAVGVGVGAAMQESDVFCPYYREQGAQFWRGVKMSEILLYWGGSERGSDFAHAKEDFPICVPIGSQTLHAVGIATAMKLRKQKRVAVAMVGDGGTSRGDFYESMNWAGVAKLPVVFVINNNQWAISVPRKQQSAALTLAQKGIAAGIPGKQVDGNDIIAVYDVVQSAIEAARNGEGPTVIEAITYRMGDHTTADDAKRYRPISEIETNQKEDPISRMKHYLMSIQAWDDEKEKKLEQTCISEVQAAVTDYLNVKTDKPESMFDYLYEKLPEVYNSQKEMLSELKMSPIHE